ncbi:MAG TPA: hypothetical protein VGK41_01160 [Solirubrobacterales bacterium]
MATRKKAGAEKALKVNVVSMPESGIGPSKYVEPEERKSGPFSDYEVRDALRILAQARKIQKNPALMRAVKKEAQRQLQAAQTTAKSL